jgi:probable phosphoglycerate mutase
MEQGIIHGRLDSPLSELGVSQALAAAEVLRNRKFDAFYSSLTGRAWQTAQIISSSVGISPRPFDLLVEQDFGTLEGKKVKRPPTPFLMIRFLLAWVIPI